MSMLSVLLAGWVFKSKMDSEGLKPAQMIHLHRQHFCLKSESCPILVIKSKKRKQTKATKSQYKTENIPGRIKPVVFSKNGSEPISSFDYD